MSIGKELFEQFYLDIYKDRWPKLKNALLHHKSHVAYAPHIKLDLKTHEFLPHVYLSENFSPPEIMENGLKNYYLLDVASLIVPYVLDPYPQSTVLDMCAAPGGKAFFLATNFNIELTANELSRDRRNRLTKVFQEYLTEEEKQKVKITGFDAKLWGVKKPESFDHILLDAPCSSEKHILLKDDEINLWKVGRTKRLHTEQWTLLSSAFLTLKKGGTLVYSTCSISPYENDLVIEKLLKKREGVELVDINLNIGEKTKYGYQLFPDYAQSGPIYFSKIKKL